MVGCVGGPDMMLDALEWGFSESDEEHEEKASCFYTLIQRLSSMKRD